MGAFRRNTVGVSRHSYSVGWCRGGACPALIALLLLVASSAYAQSLHDQARAARERGQLDSAYQLAVRAAEAEPNNAAVQFSLGQLAGARAEQVNSLRGLGIAKKSKQGFSRAVQLEPGNPLYLEGLISYLSQAPGIAGGDRDSALVLAGVLRRIDERRGINAMISTLWRGNDRNKRTADSIMEDYSRAHNDRATQFGLAGYYSNTNRPERALAVHERMLARDTNDVVARFGVARNLVVLKREPRRALTLLKAVAAVPRPSDNPGPTYSAVGLWYRMGQAYVQLGIPDSARTALTKALEVQPGFRGAQLSLDSLRRP